MTAGRQRALLLTVGTGNSDELESSLLSPLRKSIADGTWGKVVLLPSQTTIVHAERVAAAGLAIRPLPAHGAENDADAAFAHFDHEIERLLADGFLANDIVVDFTRGTKAMSAALVLAATRHGVPTLRYIVGDRDRRGQVAAGSEEIRETSTAVVTLRRRIDLAAGLMRAGGFAAAWQLLPDPDHPLAALPHVAASAESLRAMRATARFFESWDRLDYAEATRGAAAVKPTALPTGWRTLAAPRESIQWVRHLIERPDQTKDPISFGRWLRRLCVDLLANAERRLRHGQSEDALVRAYRVLELVGQARLFDRGLDSSALPSSDPEVVSLRVKLRQKGSSDFGIRRDGTLTAPRDLTARLLKEKGDPVAGELLDFDRRAGVSTAARNHSILIHGFDSRAPIDAESWRRLIDALWKLLEQDRGDAQSVESDRRIARSPDFDRAPPQACDD